MMSCKEAAQFIESYIDKALSPDDVERVEEHLTACAGCAGHFGFDEAVRKLHQSKANQIKIPKELKDKILKKLKQS